MNKLSRYLILPLLAIVVVVTSLIVFAKPAQAEANTLCVWQDSGQIQCKRPNAVGGFVDRITDFVNFLPTPGDIAVIGDLTGDPAQLSTDIANAATSSCNTGAVCNDVFYEPQISADNGYPVFCRDNEFEVGGTNVRCLHFINNNPLFAYASNATRAISPNETLDSDRIIPVGNIDAALDDADNGECGIVTPGDCRIANGAFSAAGDFSGTGLDTQTFIDAVEAAVAAEGDCIDSPLSFVLCPISDFIQGILTWTIDALTSLLQNPDLTGNGAQGLRDAVGAFVNLANSFYILIFLFIILANFIAIPGLDNYTIKKTLPKLIAAIILTQFSFLICQAVLDLGNILGETLPGVVIQAFDLRCGADLCDSAGAAFANAIDPFGALAGIQDAGDVLEVLGRFAVFNLTLFVGEIIAIIALFYLAARYLFLMMLVIFAPLAFAAWVLPNTEKFFKEWWKYLIKLSIMFLLVSMLFVVGAAFTKIFTDGLGGSVLDGFLQGLISLIIPIVVLLMVPKTLKASTAIMSAVGKAAAGTAVGKAAIGAGKGAVKKSGQEGKLAEMKAKGFGAASDAVGGTNTKFGRSLKQKQLRTEDAVSDARKKDLGLLKPAQLQDVIRRGTDPRTGELNGEAKAAKGVLAKKHREALVEGKQAFDAGLPPLSGEDRKRFDETALAAGGKTYQESVIAWDIEKQARTDGGAAAGVTPAMRETIAYQNLHEATTREIAGNSTTPPPPTGVAPDVHHKRIAYDQMHAAEVEKQRRLNPHLDPHDAAHTAAAHATLNGHGIIRP